MFREWCTVAAVFVAAPVLAQDQPVAAPPAPAGEVQPGDPPPAPPPPRERPWSEGWGGSIDLGITGADGNTQNFNFRGAVGANRKSDFNDTKLSFTYSFKTDDGTDTENRAVFDARNDWLFTESKWRVFALGALEFDEFKDYDARLSLFGGVGYELVKNERTLLIGRAGLGASREFGGTDDKWTPEALLGVDFERQIAANQKFFFTADLYPSLDNYPDYRAVAKAGYEIMLDEASKMLLKLGLEDRYDSTPGLGFRRNDLTYFITLGWAF
ncbi:MAG: YdiY family protein [Phycisphaerales bacterium]